MRTAEIYHKIDELK